MEMYSPLKGKLRRTHYEGLHLKFTMTEHDYAVQAKLGHLQVWSVAEVLVLRCCIVDAAMVLTWC